MDESNGQCRKDNGPRIDAMTKKELRKLTREDLLELLIGQAQSSERQQKEAADHSAGMKKLEEENEKLRAALAASREENEKLHTALAASREESEKLRSALAGCRDENEKLRSALAGCKDENERLLANEKKRRNKQIVPKLHKKKKDG
jgi:septal ring factor EnvC (AmiA/AmiB activator)